MTRVYFSMAIEASIAHVLRDKFEGHQFWIIFDCLVFFFFFFFFFNFLTSTYVESYFTSWKFPTLATCLIIYKWNLTFQRTFRHYFENSTPWMLPAHTWNEEKKKGGSKLLKYFVAFFFYRQSMTGLATRMAGPSFLPCMEGEGWKNQRTLLKDTVSCTYGSEWVY